MTAPDGTDRPATMLLWRAACLPSVARHVVRSAFALVASAGMSIALTSGAAAADPLLPPPSESPSDLTETVVEPQEALVGTTEAAGDALAPAVDAADPIGKPTTGTLEPVTDPVAALAEPIGDAVAPVLAPIADTSAPLLDQAVTIPAPIGDAVAPVLAAIVDANAPVTDQVVTILEPVEKVVAPVLAPIIDASAPATGQVVTSLEPVEEVADVGPITGIAAETQTFATRISRPTDPVIDSQLAATPAANRIAAFQGAFALAAPASPAVIALAESAADVGPLVAAPDRPLIASSAPIPSAGPGGVDWTPMAVFGTLLLLGLVSRALITTASLRPPTMALFVPVPPG